MRHIHGLALALLMLCAALAAQAHDGPHGPAMLARVLSAIQQGDTVAVSFEVTSLAGPLVLLGVSTPGARAVDLTPVYANFAQDVTVSSVLEFSGPPPGIFTLELDFGPSGMGGLTVIPTLGARPVSK